MLSVQGEKESKTVNARRYKSKKQEQFDLKNFADNLVQEIENKSHYIEIN